MNRKNKLRARTLAMRPIALPDDLLRGQARVTLIGDARALIENHKGVLELGDSVIKLRTRTGVLTVEGEGLYLAQARPESIMVKGRIQSITLPDAKATKGDNVHGA